MSVIQEIVNEDDSTTLREEKKMKKERYTYIFSLSLCLYSLRRCIRTSARGHRAVSQH